MGRCLCLQPALQGSPKTGQHRPLPGVAVHLDGVAWGVQLLVVHTWARLLLHAAAPAIINQPLGTHAATDALRVVLWGGQGAGFRDQMWGPGWPGWPCPWLPPFLALQTPTVGPCHTRPLILLPDPSLKAPLLRLTPSQGTGESHWGPYMHSAPGGLGGAAHTPRKASGPRIRLLTAFREPASTPSPGHSPART